MLAMITLPPCRILSGNRPVLSGNQPVFVVKGLTTNLLGLPAIQALKIISNISQA